MRTAFALLGWVCAIVLSCAGTAGADTWTQKTDMPTRRSWLRTSVVDGKIYAMGGAGGERKVEEYDPATNTWTTKADMPTGRVFFGASAVDGKIYAIGGDPVFSGTGLAAVEAYDPVTDTWTKKADMPATRDGHSTSVVNGKIYAIGGRRNGSTTAIVEEYDPPTDTWTMKANLPTPRQFLITSVVNGKIYAIGGGTSRDSSPNGPIVEAYDPVTDTWTKKADMPVSRALHTSVVDGKIYAFGGTPRGTGAPTSTFVRYDPVIDTWTALDAMPVNMTGMGASTVGRTVYVIGGTSADYPFTPRLSTVWEFTPAPDFDFNGDGVVDAQDMSLMVDHWHTDELRYDLAPPPAGDGIVDAQDLVALSEHLFEDYRIIAHWRLDETEGDVAYDSVAENDAIVLGDPVWQPADGQIDGALQFDGIHDYVDTPFILNPAEGAFSVYAWVNGGGPGQVIVSQAGAMDWLLIDPQEGYLWADLKADAGRGNDPLWSQTVITDGAWHRLGLVWDGAYRSLYVDDERVAMDTAAQKNLNNGKGGLHIGAGNALGEGSLWSGLIDDIRIYNRVVTP